MKSTSPAVNNFWSCHAFRPHFQVKLCLHLQRPAPSWKCNFPRHFPVGNHIVAMPDNKQRSAEGIRRRGRAGQGRGQTDRRRNSWGHGKTPSSSVKCGGVWFKAKTATRRRQGGEGRGGGARTRTMTLPELRMPVKVIMVGPHLFYPPLLCTVDAVMKSA